MQPDQLRREVNRLYWETDGPVTRLADGLGISRGTFYNHMDPLPAPGKCKSCGAPLFFGTRSSREAGEAHCEACGNEQAVPARESGGGRDARRLRVSAGAEEGAGAEENAGRSAGGMPLRLGWLGADEGADDRMRTQLLAVAIGAAVLGLGILYFSRRR